MQPRQGEQMRAARLFNHPCNGEGGIIPVSKQQPEPKLFGQWFGTCKPSTHDIIYPDSQPEKQIVTR